MRKRCDDAHEPFLSDEEINQPFDVRFFPLELEVVLGLSRRNGSSCAYIDLVCRSHIRILEEFLCLFPWPFFRYLNAASFLLPFLCVSVLLYRRPVSLSGYYVEKSNEEHALGLEMLEDLVQTTILLHQFVGCFWTNTLYWFEIITTKQQAHFNKLQEQIIRKYVK